MTIRWVQDRESKRSDGQNKARLLMSAWGSPSYRALLLTTHVSTGILRPLRSRSSPGRSQAPASHSLSRAVSPDDILRCSVMDPCAVVLFAVAILQLVRCIYLSLRVNLQRCSLCMPTRRKGQPAKWSTSPLFTCHSRSPGKEQRTWQRQLFTGTSILKLKTRRPNGLELAK